MSSASDQQHAPNTWQQFARLNGVEDRPVVAFGFNHHWRATLAGFVQGTRVRHVRDAMKVPEGSVVLVWGTRPISGLPESCLTIRLEDGFLRSVGLGAEFARPLSWVADFNHLYFDASGPSRLENLLNTYAFNTQELERAQNLLDQIRESGTTKYNTGQWDWQRPKDEETVILVPGQVESDASIRFGSPQTKGNIELLRRVRENNPGAWIIYKPHPDVLAGARKAGENEGNARSWCNEVVSDVGMDTLLAQIDEVHTMTSLAGFEALIRNKGVTCYGLPFYAGWGLTTDELACERRTRGLQLAELAYAALIQYPFYVSRKTGNYASPEQVLDELQQWRGTPSTWQDLLKKQVRKAVNLAPGENVVMFRVHSPAPVERIAIVGTLVDTMLGFRGELIRDMIAAGHEVYAFATDYCPETEQAIRTMGAEPVRYRMSQLGTNPVSDVMAVFQLRKLFIHHRISLSYCYFSKPAIYGTLAARMAGVPKRVAKLEGLGRVFTVSPEGDRLRKRFVRKIMAGLFRLVLPMAHKLYVLNEGDKEDLQRFGVIWPEPEVLGGIGVCLERYYFCPPVTDTIRFIFVARLLHEKGVRYFVDAAKSLGKRYPQAEFILLGAPDARRGAVDKAELKELVDQGIVTYPGPVKDVTPWFAKSSVFVLPSYYREGVPRSTQEALAMGRPVITTDLPGCRRTVRDGVNGFLVPAHDQEALEGAMLKFLREPELVRAMGLASFNFAQDNFDVRKINRRILRGIGITEPDKVVESIEPESASEFFHAEPWR